MPAFAEALAAHEENVPLRFLNMESPFGSTLPAALAEESSVLIYWRGA